VRLLVVLQGSVAVLGLIDLEQDVTLELKDTHWLKVFVGIVDFSDFVVSLACFAHVVAENLPLTKKCMQVVASFQLS
jgi:hypothetical protein